MKRLASLYFLGVALVFSAAPAQVDDIAAPIIALNQIGYLADQPKRFTAPLTPDGETFVVRRIDQETPAFTGRVVQHIGDFSAFAPAGSEHLYVVEIGRDGGRRARSDPFLISDRLWTDRLWPAAIDFMIDCRSVTGTHPSAFGGGAFRDSTYYSFEGPSLLLLLQTDAAAIAARPRQIDWDRDRARVLDPVFPFVTSEPESEGVLEAARRYYRELAPPATDAPDVVKLIHWAYGYLLMHPESRDPSGDPLPRQIHSQHVEQFAYLLHDWSAVARWLPDEFRRRCSEFAFAHWESSGLLVVDPWWEPVTYEEPPATDTPVTGSTLHPYKGRHPPGHSIAPNLMMFDVAKREGRPDALRYLAAARAQAQWLIDNLDWSDPRATKGHRMSEFRTIIGLVWFLERHPDEAPAGLKEKITAWARVAVARSANLWDFRRYDLQEHWSIPLLNEPGNLLGFTAAALAASWVIDDPVLRARLRELAFAQTDAVFGRNPLRVAGVSFPAQGFPDVERGWPIRYQDNVCARLETTRGSISASCGTEFYPYQPESRRFRHSEGWVNYNAAWNVALAYVKLDQNRRNP